MIQQMIAPIVTGRLPQQQEFSRACCCDLSPGGLSFLSPTPPSANDYVIALGHPPSLIYLRMRVVHAAFLPEEGSYLVGCTFVERVDQHKVHSRNEAPSCKAPA